MVEKKKKIKTASKGLNRYRTIYNGQVYNSCLLWVTDEIEKVTNLVGTFWTDGSKV